MCIVSVLIILKNIVEHEVEVKIETDTASLKLVLFIHSLLI